MYDVFRDTGIPKADWEELLGDFLDRITESARSIHPQDGQIVIRSLQVHYRLGEVEGPMVPPHLLRSTAFFGASAIEGDLYHNLELMMVAEALHDILTFHKGLGGGWIKVFACQPSFPSASFTQKPKQESNNGWLLYESPPL